MRCSRLSPPRCWIAARPTWLPRSAPWPGRRPTPSPLPGPMRRWPESSGWIIPGSLPYRLPCASCAESSAADRPPSEPGGRGATSRRTTLEAVPTLNDVLREQTDLDAVDVEWLHLLLGDWQLLRSEE